MVGVEGEVAEQLGGGGVDDAYVEVGDEHHDAGSGVFVAEADVVEAAVVAQGDSSGSVDAVVADAPVAVVAAVAGGGFFRRTIPIDATTADRLARHRREQLEERLLAGSEWEDNDLMVCTKLGRPIIPRNLDQKRCGEW